MNLTECIPGVHGPLREIYKVQDAVEKVAIARLGFYRAEDAKLVGSRDYLHSYISYKAFSNCIAEVCRNYRREEKIKRTLEVLGMYPALDEKAHDNDLCSSDLIELVDLPEYRDHGDILIPVFLAGVASDWDVLIPEIRRRFQIPIEETGSSVQFHPPRI